MARSDSLQGALDLLVLKILSRRPAIHGYAIMSAIKDCSREVLNAEEGSLYPALHRLEERGWVKSEWQLSATKRRTKVYRLTPDGRAQLRSETASWTDFVAAMNKVLRAEEQPS